MRRISKAIGSTGRMMKKSMLTMIIGLSLSMTLLPPHPVHGQSRGIALFVPGEDSFWEKSIFLAKNAASELGAKLEVYNAKDDPLQMVEQVKDVAKRGIDGVIFPAFKSAGKQILEITEEQKVPAILIASGIPDIQPETNYRSLKASILPNDEKAGTLLMRQLIIEAEKRGFGEIHLLAIQGDAKEASSAARLRGATRYLRSLKNVASFKDVEGAWDRETTRKAFMAYYRSKPQVNVVWCANDQMALGVVKAIEELEITQPVVVGGMDWDKEALLEIGQGRMQVSVGGQFLAAAWAVVLLYDYSRGFDLLNEGPEFEAEMVPISGSNVHHFTPILSSGTYPRKFGQFSKAQNAWIKRYRFDMQQISAGLVELAQPEAETELTEKEKAWLSEHRNIRIGVDPSRLPLEFLDATKVHSGIASDYVRLLNERLMIHMAPVPGLTWPEVLVKAGTGEIDVIPCITKTPEREKLYLFTKPYLSIPMVIVTRQDAPFVFGIQDFADHRVAVIRDYAAREFLESDHPGRTFYLAENFEEALQALSKGKVDAFVDNLVSITYTTQKLGLTNLKVATTTSYPLGLSFAVRKDWPILVSILNKSLDTISHSDKATINNRWSNVHYERGVDWPLILKFAIPILVGGVLLLATFVAWNRRLSREVTERKRAEEELAEAEERSRLVLESTGEGIIGVDATGKMTFVNPAALQILGYSKDEFVGRVLHDLVHHSYPDGAPYPREACPMYESFALGKANRVDDEVLWRKGNTSFPVEYTSTPVTKEGAVVGAVVTFRDITERKKVEAEVKEYVADLERFNRLVIGREERMIQLKEEINGLMEKLGGEKKYKVVQ